MGKAKAEINQWSRWYLVPEKDKKKNPLLKIKRYRTVIEDDKKKTKWERCKEDYNPRAPREELERIVRQLNLRYDSEIKRAKEAYEWRHAFITEKIMEKYKSHLEANVDSKGHRDSLYFYARKNLNWFIEKCRESDPVEWKQHQDNWIKALFCDHKGTDADKYRMWDEPVAPDTISKQMQAINRFLEWIHELYPKTFPSVRLKYSRNKMRGYRLRWKTKTVGQYIPDAHMKIILENIDPKIRPYVWRQKTFGLRLQEAMACQPEDVKERYLHVHQQLVAVTDGKPRYDLLKSREARKVPYWFATPDDAYDNFADTDWLMHPDTYSHKFAEEMKRLSEQFSKKLNGKKLDYATHDLRRTFISNAFRSNQVADEIRLASGHKDIRTTMKYAKDHRDLGEDATYIPLRKRQAA